MAWHTWITGDVDANSPANSTLFGWIKDCFEYLKSEAATWTQNKAGGGYNLTGVGNLTSTTGTITTLDSTTANLTTANITTANVTTLTGPALHAGVVPKISTRTTTADPNASKQVVDSSSDIDFTEAVTADQFLVYLPSMYANKLFCVDAVVDANTLDLAETTKDSKTDLHTLSVLLGTTYHLYKITDKFPGTAGWTKLKTLTWSAGSEATQDYSFKATHGGLNRRLIAVMFDRTNIGDYMTASYISQSLINESSGNIDPAYAFFWAEAGTNNISVSKTGTNGSATAEIWIEDVTFPEAYSPA